VTPTSQTQALLRRYKSNALSIHQPCFSYIAGGRACYTSLFDDTAYPLGFIAPIQLIWKPISKPQTSPAVENPADSDKNGKNKILPSKEVKPTEDMQRTLWLRIHPGAYDTASSALTRSAMRVLAAAKVAGEPAAEIEIADLRGHANAFELTGPKSSQVIHGVMKPVSEDKRKEIREVCAAYRRLIQNSHLML
jgi:ribonuclease P/MRP protein subunit POP1